MNKLLYSLWLNIGPFRSKWILPLIVLTILILIIYFFGNTDEMKCNWDVRDRWECTPRNFNEG